MNPSSIQSRKEFNEIVDYAGQYISDWMRRQLNDLTNRKNLLIAVSSSYYLLGNFKIYQDQDQWAVENRDRLVHSFLTRQLAILYCLYHNNNEVAEAQQLLTLDQTLNSLLTDKILYQTQLKNPKFDYNKKITLQARLSENQQKINMLSEQIKKILVLAKYKKIRKIL
jgi:hypothetical protein